MEKEEMLQKLSDDLSRCGLELAAAKYRALVSVACLAVVLVLVIAGRAALTGNTRLEGFWLLGSAVVFFATALWALGRVEALSAARSARDALVREVAELVLPEKGEV